MTRRNNQFTETDSEMIQMIQSVEKTFLKSYGDCILNKRLNMVGKNGVKKKNQIVLPGMKTISDMKNTLNGNGYR